MSDRPALNETEIEARRALVAIAHSMLIGETTFLEGSERVLRLKQLVGAISDCDDDFDIFLVIASETDHLPLQVQRHLWVPAALKALALEFESAEKWAGSLARNACTKLIARFSPQ